MSIIIVLTTIDSADSAQQIASALVDRKLAACVQISRIDSVYAWQGEVQRDPEWRLLVKTTAERYADVESAIRDLHTYDLPAVVAVPVERGYEPFLDWVADNSSGM